MPEGSSHLLKKLASQTAVYGLSSIVGRLLNYLLVPLHTRVFIPEEYGVVTEMYSYVAFLLVILTYGFETAFFRFARNHDDSPKVYSTALISLIITSALFIGVCILFASDISSWIRYPEHPEYIIWFAVILGTDAITSIPFARLRLENKALRFASIRLINIGINIFLNVWWFVLMPALDPAISSTLGYNPEYGLSYVFLANLFASLITLIILSPMILTISWRLDKVLWKQMMVYAFPLLIGGLAGITNEMFSRVSLKYHLPADIAMHELGVFGACYKVAVLMTIFIQTFRFAAEPFFFSRSAEKDAKELYADVMNWFVITCSAIYLGIVLFMDIIKHFISNAYFEGLGVVPILLMAQLFLGIFFNLSIWFKLNDKTRYGAYLAIFGAIITIILNYLWIPTFGYYGAAWATFVCYFLMMFVSYILGQKHYPVNYNLKKVIGYPTSVALAAFAVNNLIYFENEFLIWILRFILFSAFVAVVWKLEIHQKKLISPPDSQN